MAQNDKVNILVVDDLPDKLLVFRTILEDLGENLVMASSGEEALRRLLEQDFAVVLLDVNMPGMNGFETAELIRRRKKSAHTPIIFITAFNDEAHTARGYSLGAVDYIPTPVVPEILRSKVKVFVDLFRMTERVKKQAEEHVALAREQTARAAAEESSRRLAFLAEASRTLAGSLDPETTARNLARVAVPFLADVAGVTLAKEHGQPCRTELAWVSGPDTPIHQARWMGAESCPDDLRAALLRALTSGRRELLESLPVPLLLESDRQLAIRVSTALVLPLCARGRTLGVLTLAQAGSSRRFDSQDVTLAEDLAGRAAIALDNASLYQNIQEGDRRKSEFLSMLAHELRNPLGPIRNAVTVFEMLPLPDPVLVQTREIIARQVTHMTRLIDDLLDVSRLTRGKILLRKEAVDLSQLVRSTTGDYRPTVEQAGLRLEVSLPEQSLWTWGDPTRLSQVVGNLIHNATKFTEPGGLIRIELEESRDREVILRVRDNGIGMDAFMLDRLFETFAQADRSLDRSKGGLGLGLALVKGLIDLHGGSVEVRSAGPGKGTEVMVRLPLHVAVAPLPPLVLPQQASSALRVLVVEDNRDAAESMRTLLTLLGHEVRVAGTGEAGLELAQDSPPEVILCDLGLPGEVDGYAFARQIRRQPLLASGFLIAVTGYGQIEDRRRTQEAGFDAHLTKPVDLNHLKQILASLAAHP